MADYLKRLLLDNFQPEATEENKAAAQAQLTVFGVVRDKQRVLNMIRGAKNAKVKENVFTTAADRLICTTADRKGNLDLTVDGVPCANVRYFSLSPVWPGHKVFPVALFRSSSGNAASSSNATTSNSGNNNTTAGAGLGTGGGLAPAAAGTAGVVTSLSVGSGGSNDVGAAGGALNPNNPPAPRSSNDGVREAAV